MPFLYLDISWRKQNCELLSFIYSSLHFSHVFTVSGDVAPLSSQLCRLWGHPPFFPSHLVLISPINSTSGLQTGLDCVSVFSWLTPRLVAFVLWKIIYRLPCLYPCLYPLCSACVSPTFLPLLSLGYSGSFQWSIVLPFPQCLIVEILQYILFRLASFTL